MLIVETIRKIRLSVHRDGRSLRRTAKDLNLSRNTVRKVIRSQKTAFKYRRENQPMPKLGAHIKRLIEKLESNSFRGRISDYKLTGDFGSVTESYATESTN